MVELKKVIKGLECCRRGFCFACPYNDGIYETTDCKQRWADDALAILKADLQAQQEAQDALETEAYMEQWEPTYNPEDGSL